MKRPRRWAILVAVLRLEAAVVSLAALAVFLPTSWMEAANLRLGLEPFADTPLTQYLTRSLSALYAMHAGVLWVAASDVERFSPLVTYLGAATFAFGLALLGIDLHAGLPWQWTLGEAPGTIAAGAAVLVLQRWSRGNG